VSGETKAEREKRLADALRANLRRRKDKGREEKPKEPKLPPDNEME
jgi:hypothetical protein